MIDDVPDRWTVNRQMPPADVLAANSLSDGILIIPGDQPMR